MAETERVGAMLAQRMNLAWRLGIVLVLAVLAFDLCSVLYPRIAGMPLGSDNPYTLGTLFAFLFVAGVIGCAVYYVRALNREQDARRDAGSAPPP